MARDILSEYGPESPSPKEGPGSSGLTTEGGKPYEQSVKYSPPQGPKHMMNERPGLMGGENNGNKGSQGRH